MQKTSFSRLKKIYKKSWSFTSPYFRKEEQDTETTHALSKAAQRVSTFRIWLIPCERCQGQMLSEGTVLRPWGPFLDPFSVCSLWILR